MRSLLFRLRASVGANKGQFSWAEFAGCAALVGLTLLFLGVSWRKWPDPVVDFGKELYTSWRLTQGAVLYRDAGDFYGPLSKYLNAGLFALFGPGMMILVAANLVVFAGIVTTLYLLFRRAWGVGAALLSSSLFISVFGFSQLVGVGNYNYATPYSHEATHGLLVCLALVLSRWMEKPTRLASALAGALFGLTLVLKPEMILAAGLVTLAAFAIRWHWQRSFPFAAAPVWLAGAALPTLAFAVYFSAHVPWRAALPLACHAWLSVATDDTAGNLNQKAFMGFDHWKRNLALHLLATLSAILIVAGMGAVARVAEQFTNLWRRILLGGLLLGGIAGLGCLEIPWFRVGRCLLGLTLIYLLVCAISLQRHSTSGVNARTLKLRFLIAVLAAALMARMLLNGRIYQYGFFQAALAGALIPAVITFEMPARFALRRFGRGLMAVASLLLLACGAVTLCLRSREAFSDKTFAIGSGADLFYAFSPDTDPRGPVIRAIQDRLKPSPPGQWLLVLPEGEMINYLVRMPSPVAPPIFFASELSNGREEGLVAQLRAHPPDWVVMLSRDLRDYGVERYGELPGQGLYLVSWTLANYRQEFAMGGNPLDARQADGILLSRRR